MHFPKDYFYNLDHVWIRLSGDKAIVGLTEELDEILESVTAIDLPRKGDELYQGDDCITLHYGSGNLDIHSPLTGRILKVNPYLRHNPENVQLSHYKDGWLFEMEYDDEEEIDMLLKRDEYQEEVESRH